MYKGQETQTEPGMQESLGSENRAPACQFPDLTILKKALPN